MRAWLVSVLLGCGRSHFAGVPDAAGDAPPDARATYREEVAADHPLAYWRLGEAQNGPARDETGGDDGQYTGTCMFGVPGALPGDPALGLDGATCKVLLGTTYSFTATAPWTVEAWIELAPGGSTFKNIIGAQTRDTQNPIDGYALVVGSTGLALERSVGGADVKTPGVTVPIGGFVHVAATYDGLTIRTYADGLIAGAIGDTRAMPAYATPLLIGASVAGNYFPGVIDEVAVYTDALSPARIRAHHDAIAP